MSVSQPHFLLRCEAWEEEDRGEWNFVLTAADGSATFEACDTELETRGDRLELLAVVRALESLDQPSYITLAAGGRYVRRVLGLQPAPEFEAWLHGLGMTDGDGRLLPVDASLSPLRALTVNR